MGLSAKRARAATRAACARIDEECKATERHQRKIEAIKFRMALAEIDGQIEIASLEGRDHFRWKADDYSVVGLAESKMLDRGFKWESEGDLIYKISWEA